MMRCLAGSLLLLAVTALSVDAKSYNGHRLMRVVPTTPSQVAKLKFMEEDLEGLDFWTEPALNRNVDINIPPTLLTYVTMNLATVGLQGEIIHTDLQKLIDQNAPKSSNSYVTMKAKALVDQGLTHPRMIPFITGEAKAPEWVEAKLKGIVEKLNDDIVGTFPRHEDLMQWLSDKVLTHPDLAEIEDIGTTYEGKIQRMIKIGAGLGGDKPIIWVDSAIHAREWLTVGTTVWIINKMLTTYQTDPTVRYLMDQYDWYFLPIANPDGYEYTRTDRLWRKTRTPTSSFRCAGADPNRNWDYRWMESGTSTNPCSTTYGGSSAFSEPCTQNMRDAILSVKDRMKMYMGVHSYSQMWLTPYAAGSPKPNDYNELLDVANSGNSALQAVHGTRFLVGTPPDILYAASGGAYDWVKAVAGVKYTYTFELRPDGNAWNGFVVPESEIQPSGEEIWAALADVADRLLAV